MNTQHNKREIMKKSYIVPKSEGIEVEYSTNLMSASFTDATGTGTISMDNDGSYTGEDALSRKGDTSIWDNEW